MADEDDRDDRGCSPSETYYPFCDDDNVELRLRDAADQSTHDYYSGTEEAEGDVEEITETELSYGTTPPQRRIFRRVKERQGPRVSSSKNSGRDFINKECAVSRRRNQPKSVFNVIKDAHIGDPTLRRLSGFDSDDNLNIESIREKRDKRKKENRDSKKSQTKARGHDRLVKNMSDNFSALNVSSIAQAPEKLESSGRFAHLLTKPAALSVSAESREARSQWTEPAECPQDRIDFSKTFSMLINLGTQAKKDKEKKLATTKRQMSTELERWQSQFMDMMWIELNAYLHGSSFENEQTLLQAQRETLGTVLEDIMDFQFRGHSVPPVTYECTCCAENERCVDGSCRNQPHLEDSVSATFHEVTLTRDTVRLQEEALAQVQHILERLDSCERLYPTSKQLGSDYPLYREPAFTLRVKCLNLWLNITCDLCHKIKLFGRIIGAEQHGIEWPVINFDYPFPSDSTQEMKRRSSSIPFIHENDVEACSSDDEVEDGVGQAIPEADTQFLSPLKQVKFSFGSDSARSSRDASPTQRNVALPELSPPKECSTPTLNSRSSVGSVSASLSRASSEISIDEVGRPAIYRHYVDRCLKKMGMQRLIIRLRDVLDCTLQRAMEALKSPRHGNLAADLKRYPSDEAGLHEAEMATSPMSQAVPRSRFHFGRSTSLAEHGEWTQEFQRMKLPSFRPSYLFLVRVPLDIVHECLRIRLEQRPMGDPSFLSIRQLIRECKDVLTAATIVKQYYQYMVDPVIWDEKEAEEKFTTDLDQFDSDLRSMLEVYFSFLQSWIYRLQSLPEGSQDLKSALEDEWDFTRNICIYIVGGEAEAGKRFSSLASSLLTLTADFLDNGIDEHTRSLYDQSGMDEDEDGETNNINGQDFMPGIECDDLSLRPRFSAEVKSSVQIALRSFKNLFHEARERATKALGFAKKLRKDLEIAADFNINVTTAELFEKLLSTDHVRVRAPLSTGYMMFVPQRIVDNKHLILQLLNVTSGRDNNTSEDMSSRDEGYLLLMRCEAGIDHNPTCPRWCGKDVIVEPTAETAIALSHIRVEGLLYVVIHSSLLGSQRKEFEQLMGNTLVLVYEQTPCHQAIAESLSELKLNALELQEKVVDAVKQVDDKLSFNDVIQYEDNLLKLYRETLLQCYNFGFEYSKEVMRLISSDQRQRLCHSLVKFAAEWMQFVLQKCERGRGTRPRWATQGLDFLTVVCDPKFLTYLSEDEFAKFKQTISDCLIHVIGTLEQRSLGQGLSIARPTIEVTMRQPMRIVSWPEPPPSKFSRSTSARSVSMEPVTLNSSAMSSISAPFLQPDYRARRFHESRSEVNIYDGDDGGLVMDIQHLRHRASAAELKMSSTSRQERIRQEIKLVEGVRDKKLQEKHRIGHVTDKVREPDFRFTVRRVNFRWQRGNKIGEGHFGKVYTAVNMVTGELMAMKEMKLQPNDLQQLREICDEIKIFESIQHPNLVKYYGVEVHKEEMLMFMEYCDTGTIEEAAKMGLPEYLIRRYTREIVQAVNHLHENSIVHRDIKGANIFLTSTGHVKLGDFGCSVKLRSHSTMPGEFNNLVGTTAYMAPEVFTQNDQAGYGRAADIWSLGCVVIEMATGKRPWHELENDFQIIYKVGMGQRPAIPEGLSPEGKDFLEQTLIHDASERASASQLLDHLFTKVYSDQEE